MYWTSLTEAAVLTGIGNANSAQTLVSTLGMWLHSNQFCAQPAAPQTILALDCVCGRVLAQMSAHASTCSVQTYIRMTSLLTLYLLAELSMLVWSGCIQCMSYAIFAESKSE